MTSRYKLDHSLAAQFCYVIHSFTEFPARCYNSISKRTKDNTSADTQTSNHFQAILEILQLVHADC